jgi:hypothetical protein
MQKVLAIFHMGELIDTCKKSVISKQNKNCKRRKFIGIQSAAIGILNRPLSAFNRPLSAFNQPLSAYVADRKQSILIFLKNRTYRKRVAY